MRHESIPMTFDERKREAARFFRVIVPETRPVAQHAMSNMLGMGTLRQASASRLFQDLWNTPDEFFTDVRNAWKAKHE